jgi:hypothetical protein
LPEIGIKIRVLLIVSKGIGKFFTAPSVSPSSAVGSLLSFTSITVAYGPQSSSKRP